MVEKYIKNFNLEQIYESGQCFRWIKINDNSYEVRHLTYKLIISQEKNKIIFNCSDNEFNTIWKDYFDLDTSYEDIINEAQKYNDNFLISAIKYSEGIRILKQDYWEAIVCFIISQNNNIPRITKIVNSLCEYSQGTIPTANEVLNMNLSEFGLGYRDRYLKSAAEWWIKNKQCLSNIIGVGEKVENCIRLFGLHELNCCPIDTWMKKVFKEDYNGNIPEWIESPFAGVYQQYIFYYKRKKSQG